MEATIVYWGYIGVVYWSYMGGMGKKMEATVYVWVL